jgi:hypothetical protein
VIAATSEGTERKTLRIGNSILVISPKGGDPVKIWNHVAERAS